MPVDGSGNGVAESSAEFDPSSKLAADSAIVDSTPAIARAIAVVSCNTNARLMNT